MDVEVYQGASTVTIEHLTGEAKPLERKVGDRIPGGARNLEGMMVVKVQFSTTLYYTIICTFCLIFCLSVAYAFASFLSKKWYSNELLMDS